MKVPMVFIGDTVEKAIEEMKKAYGKHYKEQGKIVAIEAEHIVHEDGKCKVVATATIDTYHPWWMSETLA